MALLIGQIDRADEEFEAFLLEILSDFAVTIPEIGTITAARRPVVILTSDRTRELHDALKRRLRPCGTEHSGQLTGRSPGLRRVMFVIRPPDDTASAISGGQACDVRPGRCGEGAALGRSDSRDEALQEASSSWLKGSLTMNDCRERTGAATAKGYVSDDVVASSWRPYLAPHSGEHMASRTRRGTQMNSQLSITVSQIHQHELRQAARQARMAPAPARRFSVSLRSLRLQSRAPRTAPVSPQVRAV